VRDGRTSIHRERSEYEPDIAVPSPDRSPCPGYRNLHRRKQRAPCFSDRQRAVNARNGTRFVYTPQLILQGKDYRRATAQDDIADRIGAANRRTPGASIVLRLDPPANGHLAAEGIVTVTQPAPVRTQAYLALYADRLSSQVTAGETRGQRLHHDFVVRSLIGPYAAGPQHKLQFRHVFPLGAKWKAADLSVAAVVQNPATGAVLQAVAMRTCK
jgi:hypothetical protein